MTVPLDTVNDIRSMDAAGRSRSEIARMLHVSRNTVAKYADMKDMSPAAPMPRRRGRPALEGNEEWVAGVLEADLGTPRKQRHTARRIYDSKNRSEGTINRIDTVHSLLGAFMEPFRGVSAKHLGAYLAWFKWCRTFMATDSGTAERTVALQLANGVCRSRIRDIFNVLPPYMDYWVASAA